MSIIASSAGALEQPQIMSLNVCADQLLMQLAPSKVHSLSPLARDPHYSYHAQKAHAFSVNTGRGEEVLLTRPNLVLAGRYDGKARLQLLARANIRVIVMDPWTSLHEGRTALAKLGHTLDATSEINALIDDMDKALAETKNIAPIKRRVAVLQRRGYTAGTMSLFGELIHHMGLEPYVPRDQKGTLLSQLHPQLGGFVRLEHLIIDPPDYVILGREDQSAIDQGSAFLAHPALRDVLPREKRLIVPTLLSACEGPTTPALIRAMGDEIKAKVK
jgi:iron complex transport system substrate-binding protein